MMNPPRSTASQFSPSRRAIIATIFMGPVIDTMSALAAVAADAAEIKIENFAFTPQELTVPVGATVTWLNSDDVPHSVVDKNKLFRSKALDTNNSFSFTFANAGTYDYFCGLHPHMTGKIIVK